MKLVANEVALEAVTQLAPLLTAIARRDRSLMTQVRDAASSIVLNCGEGSGNDPGTARSRYFTASGSTREVRAGLALAVAWGYLRREDVDPIEAKLDRVSALLYGLTHGRR